MRAALVLCAALAVSTGAVAETLVYPEADIAIEIPEGWIVEDEEARLNASDPGGGLALSLDLLDLPDLDMALERLPRMMELGFQDFTFRDLYDEIQVNGLDGVILDGGGRLGGLDVDIAILVIDTPLYRPLLVIAYAPPADFAGQARTLAAIMRSVRPLDP